MDTSRAPIQGARVSIRTPDGTSLSFVFTDENGTFPLPPGPGVYFVRIAAEGFQETSATITLPMLEPRSVEFVLSVSGGHESVTVTEGPSYVTTAVSSGTKTLTPLRDVPQSISVVTKELMRDQMMMSMADVVRYTPGITAIQGENNRDQVVIRGNSSSADFFVNGVRDDVQYYRDLYNLERVEALKGPNAMIFGRGGGGGLINRVTKEAGFTPLREISLLGGSYNGKRIATDFDQPLRNTMALRLNGMYENSGSFRNGVDLSRYGISPSFTYMPSAQTKIVLAYEHFYDTRVADRGIPSFLGRPVDVPISTFYGNPTNSNVRARVNMGSVYLEQQIGRLSLQNRLLTATYDRGYQNYVPGAVTADQSGVALSAYNNATQRRNVLNQTDLTYGFSTRSIQHTVLGGAEVGRQSTDNFRRTGFFNNTTTSILVPFTETLTQTPVTFRQSATDANNHIQASIAATYLQDQIRLSRFVQVIAGLRFDHFDLRFHNNRTAENLRRIDNLVSPRVGIVLKPMTPVSLYANYSVSYLPSSGDQFASLTAITQQLRPEKFNNYEAGVKWDAARGLSLAAAVYRLSRPFLAASNSASTGD